MFLMATPDRSRCHPWTKVRDSGASRRVPNRFRERKKCPWFQNPVGFSEKLGAVGDVHGDVLSVGTVKKAIWIWQPLPVSLLNRDPIFHAEQ
jgi:hypothetical protein